MKSNRRILVALSVLAFVSITLMSLRPVPAPNERNTIFLQGMVTEVLEGRGEADIVIKIEGRDDMFYINRGLEKGLSIDKLNKQILNKNVELVYINHWTPLIGKFPKHISELSLDQTIVYSEFPDQTEH